MKSTNRIFTLPAVLFALLCLAQSRSLEYRASCQTPFKERGECIMIRDCPKFAHTIDGPIDKETYNTLRQLRCGTWSNYPLICCAFERKVTSFTSTTTSVEYGRSCRTPDRSRGSCIRLTQCPHFAYLVGQENIPQSTLAILKESYCGEMDEAPLICCPSDKTISPITFTSTTPLSTTVVYKGICWTPNAMKGTCIKARDCPQFASAIAKEPESEKVKAALNESYCGKRRNHQLVCCPDDDPTIQISTPETIIETIELGNSCQTQTGETGTCKTNCPHHHGASLIYDSEGTSNKKSFCGEKNGVRLVCCPSVLDHSTTEAKCQSLSGEDGECIALNECPALSSLVDPTILTKHNLEKLKKLHCGPHDEDNKYCCPINKRDGNVKHHKNLYLLHQNLCGTSPLFSDLENHAEVGKKAKLSTIPWMALIAYNSGDSSSFRCVGSIISRRYILTAARCVTNLSRDIQPVSVRLGEHNLEYALDCTNNACAPAPQNIAIEEIIPHPEFDIRSSHKNDIAIIRLAKEISFGAASVQPVCLPIEESMQGRDYTNKRLLVSGWFTSKGEISPELLQDVVQGVSHKVCSEAYENITVISPDSHICVYNGRGDDCLGKGASPLVSFEDYLGKKSAVQQGIGLTGPDICYQTTQPVVYTRVDKFVNWILDHLRP